MTQVLCFFVALAGVLWRICSRRMSALEWLVLLFVAVNIFLVQVQMFVGENGKFVWILRYHQAALTLLYGWAAWFVVEAVRSTGGWRRKGIVALAAVWLVATGATSLWRIVKHEFVESKRNARMLAAHWAEEIISRDWDGPKADEEHFFTVQEYHPRRRPIIQSPGAYLPYIAKGRWYSLSSDVRKHEKPDYAFVADGGKPPVGMICIAEKSFTGKNRRFRLYRAKRGNNGK